MIVLGTIWNGLFHFAVECSATANPPNSVMTLNTNGVFTKAAFVCKNGYYMKGISEVACLPNGTWESSFPSCSKSIKYR